MAELSAPIARAASAARRPQVVSVNGVAIPRGAIAQEVQHHRASSPAEAWTLATRALAIRELLAQEASRLGVVAEPAEDGEGRRETLEEAKFRALLEREVTTPRADEATCRRYYEQNRKRFRSSDLFEAAHILIAADPRDAKARDEARAAAKALIADLQRHPTRFGAFAQAHSACPSKQQGGNLGQIGDGQTVPEFEAALRAMEPGELHPQPVESRYGLHVVRLDRRIDGQEIPFAFVREQVAEYLDEAVRRRAMRQYVSVLAARAEVVGVDLGAASGPLVQ